MALNAPDTVLLAADEASLYLQATLMRVWAPVGQTPVIKVAANRDGTHFYGALDLQSGQEVTLQARSMTSAVSAVFLTHLLQTYPDKPLLLLWDRATWHRGEAVKAVLEANPRLEILWFPPGSPELNPQEHVWKAVREAVAHNHTRAKLAELVEAFDKHLLTTRFACSLLDRYAYQELATMFN